MHGLGLTAFFSSLMYACINAFKALAYKEKTYADDIPYTTVNVPAVTQCCLNRFSYELVNLVTPIQVTCGTA